MKNLQKITLLFILGVLFSINVQANNIHNVNPINDCALEKTSIEHYLMKDGKWKERLKEFGEGFLEGFYKGLGGSISNGGGNNGGLTEGDFNYIKQFALTQVQSTENASEMIYSLQMIILSDADYTSTQELSTIFNNDPQMDDIFKKILAPYGPYDDTTNLQKTPGSFWKGLGKVIGFIAGVITKAQLP